MEVTLNIVRSGNAKGTVGWLAENAHTIYIGETKAGKQGAWLHDKDSVKLTVLAVRDAFEPDGFARALNVDDNHAGCFLTTDILFTEAAYETIKKIQEIAIDEMNKGEDYTFECSVKIETEEKV